MSEIDWRFGSGLLTVISSRTIILSAGVNDTESPGEPTPPNVSIQSIVPYATLACERKFVRVSPLCPWVECSAVLLVEIALEFVYHDSMGHV
jgi:hypothetical protein